MWSFNIIDEITKIYANAATYIKLYFAIFSKPNNIGTLTANNEDTIFKSLFSFFTASDISSDDIEIENQTDNLQTVAQRREMIMQLLEISSTAPAVCKSSNPLFAQRIS